MAPRVTATGNALTASATVAHPIDQLDLEPVSRRSTASMVQITAVAVEKLESCVRWISLTKSV